jgi:hypothetical protein
MKMKKNYVSQTTTCSKEYKIVSNDEFFDIYWDDGYIFTQDIIKDLSTPIKE